MRHELGRWAPPARSAAVLLRLRRWPAEEGCEEPVRGVPEEQEGEGLADRRIAAPASLGDMRQYEQYVLNLATTDVYTRVPRYLVCTVVYTIVLNLLLNYCVHSSSTSSRSAAQHVRMYVLNLILLISYSLLSSYYIYYLLVLQLELQL